MFVSNVCADMSGKNSGKHQSPQIWNELQCNLNLDLLDQSTPKIKNLIM